MGFGIEILFVLMLGVLILGPKRLHTMLAHVARAKAELENATRGLNLNSLQNWMPRPEPARTIALMYYLVTASFVQLSDLYRTFRNLPKTRLSATSLLQVLNVVQRSGRPLLGEK